MKSASDFRYTARKSLYGRWGIAVLAIAIVIGCNIWGKGMIKIIPILLGVLVSYLVAAFGGAVDFTAVKEAAWIGFPFQMKDTVFSLFGNCDSGMLISSIAIMMPIALATMVAQRFGKPLIYAKKAKSDNIEGGLYQSDIHSYTYKKKVTLLVSKEWFSADEKVLIIDDFMANGYAMGGLVDIVNKCGATLEGIGVAVEKGFQGGGDRLRAAGYNLKSLAIIESAEPGNIVFRED